jgi:hypothetical protein
MRYRGAVSAGLLSLAQPARNPLPTVGGERTITRRLGQAPSWKASRDRGGHDRSRGLSQKGGIRTQAAREGA